MTEAYQKLRSRIAEKRATLNRQEEDMKLQFQDIKSHLTPGSLLKTAVRNIVRTNATPSALQTGISVGAGFLADRLFLRQRNFIVRSLGLFAVRKLVNKFTNRLSPPETS